MSTIINGTSSAITFPDSTVQNTAALTTGGTIASGTVTTLTTTTISDGTNSTSSTNCIQGSAKAWVKFTGITTATITNSYNVSSVTRVATGIYTVAYTNALSSANYAVGLSCQPNTASYNDTNAAAFAMLISVTYPPTTTGCGMVGKYGSLTSPYDMSIVTFLAISN